MAVGVYLGTRRNSAVELELPDTPHISPVICDSILAGRLALMGDLRRLNDFKLLQMAWIYDVDFAPTLSVVRSRRYLELILSTLPDAPVVGAVYKAVKRVLDQRCSS